MIGVWLPLVGRAHAVEGEPWKHVGLVPGFHVAVALGPTEGSRVGAGLDLAYQWQHFTSYSGTTDGNGTNVYWAEEHLAWNYGPVLHVWRVDGAWHSSLGARFGVTHPLRVGTDAGWIPGPGLTVELAPMTSTRGFAALDGQLAVDGPYAQVRLGTAWTFRRWVAPRMHLGVFGVPPPRDAPHAVRSRPE